MYRQFYGYILSSLSRATYVGVTNNLLNRVWQHRNEGGSRFAKKYRIDRLVHFEVFSDSYNAISREKEIKGWRREKKVKLIEANNPDWRDLAIDWEIPSSATQPVP